MNGKDGNEPFRQDGGVMRLETLISDNDTAAYDKIMEENRSVSEKGVKKTSKDLVGMAALRVRRHIESGLPRTTFFDMDRFVSFETQVPIYPANHDCAYQVHHPC